MSDLVNRLEANKEEDDAIYQLPVDLLFTPAYYDKIDRERCVHRKMLFYCLLTRLKSTVNILLRIFHVINKMNDRKI